MVDKGSNRWTRRKFLAVSGAGISAAALTACAPSGPAAAPAAPDVSKVPVSLATPDVSKEPVTLAFFTYSNANQLVVPTEVIKQYMQENPHVTIKHESGSNATVLPQIVASYKTTGKPTINAGYFNADSTARGDLEDLWLPLDPSIVTNMNDVLAPYRRPADKGVGWGVSPIGLAYRTDLVKPAPTSWLDLLDPKWKGRVGLADATLYHFNGLVAINRLLGGTERNPQPGIKAFSDAAKLGQFHSVFAPVGSILQPLLVTGVVWMVGYAKAVVQPWADDGAPIGLALPKEGMIALPLYYQVVKGSTPAQIYHSQQLINRLLSPTISARDCELQLAAPANGKVKLGGRFATDPFYGPDAVRNAMQVDWTALAETAVVWLAAWNAEIKANLKQ